MITEQDNLCYCILTLQYVKHRCVAGYLLIIDNYSILQSTWETAVKIARDTESKAQIQGVSSQMNTFNFLFGTYLSELVLRHTDNLGKLYSIGHCLQQSCCRQGYSYN